MKKIMYMLLGVIMLTLTPSIVKAETTNTSTQMTTTIAGTEFTYQFHGNSKDKVDIVKVSNIESVFVPKSVKKIIVPKGSKTLKVLKNAKYGKVNDSGEESYSADGNNYFGSVMKIVIR